jgi:hypothetical protein
MLPLAVPMSPSPYLPPTPRLSEHPPLFTPLSQPSIRTILEKQLLETKIRVDHCRILLATLQETTRGVEQLCVTGRWPSGVDVNDFHRIARKEIWIRQILEDMEREVHSITKRLAEAAEAEAYWRGTAAGERHGNNRNGRNGGGYR